MQIGREGKSLPGPWETYDHYSNIQTIDITDLSIHEPSFKRNNQTSNSKIVIGKSVSRTQNNPKIEILKKHNQHKSAYCFRIHQKNENKTVSHNNPHPGQNKKEEKSMSIQNMSKRDIKKIKLDQEVLEEGNQGLEKENSVGKKRSQSRQDRMKQNQNKSKKRERNVKECRLNTQSSYWPVNSHKRADDLLKFSKSQMQKYNLLKRKCISVHKFKVHDIIGKQQKSEKLPRERRKINRQRPHLKDFKESDEINSFGDESIFERSNIRWRERKDDENRVLQAMRMVKVMKWGKKPDLRNFKEHSEFCFN